MKILEIREKAAPLKDNISNAYINFSQMTTSMVAIVTDVIRDGKRVTGYGFNSNGRYAPRGILQKFGRHAGFWRESQSAELLLTDLA